MKKVSINVTVLDATPSRLKSVEASLVRQGVEVDSVLDTIGVITGKVAESKFASLDVGSVAKIEPGEDVQLPPPDAEIQ